MLGMLKARKNPPPRFDASRLGQRCIAIVGMNGIGKSRFGKRLATALGLEFVDTDLAFRERHGEEQPFIDAHGWPAFRLAEEEIVVPSLSPGRVVALGGGAVESPTVRESLKGKALVLWIQAGRKRAHRNLRRARLARPEFADGLTSRAVQDLLARRTPLYEEVADIVLYPHLRYEEQLPMTITLLRRHFSRARASS